MRSLREPLVGLHPATGQRRIEADRRQQVRRNGEHGRAGRDLDVARADPHVPLAPGDVAHRGVEQNALAESLSKAHGDLLRAADDARVEHLVLV